MSNCELRNWEPARRVGVRGTNPQLFVSNLQPLLSSVLCLLPSVFCPLSSSFCLLLAVRCQLSFSIPHFVFLNPQSAFRNPKSSSLCPLPSVFFLYALCSMPCASFRLARPPVSLELPMLYAIASLTSSPYDCSLRQRHTAFRMVAHQPHIF